MSFQIHMETYFTSYPSGLVNGSIFLRCYNYLLEEMLNMNNVEQRINEYHLCFQIQMVRSE